MKKLPISKVPLLGIPDSPITSTTQNHLPIADIIEDIVLLKDGGASLVMESTALNFSLLSEREQEAVVAAYAAFINSLSFSVQILIRSQRKDISTYLEFLDKQAKKITNPKLAKLMSSYRGFLNETVKKKNVLGKRFYVVVPFTALELGVTPKSALHLVKSTGPLPFPKSYIIKKAKITLYPRRDHLMRQAGRLGIKLRQLSTIELIELFYTIYNPPAETLAKPKEPVLKQ